MITLMSHKPTDRPWEKIGADIYTIFGKDYLIIVDYFSNFWEIDCLPDPKASTCIRKLKSHFARQGIPDVVISDNGPPALNIVRAALVTSKPMDRLKLRSRQPRDSYARPRKQEVIHTRQS